jgi:hypothetical protein
MTADSRDRAMSGMLRQSLGNTGPQENCLDAETIAAYYEHSLDTPLNSKCEAHLAECARCRQQIAMMVRAETSAPAKAKAKITWIWDWRFLAPAAAALLVLTVWGVRRSTLTVTSPKAPGPLVAMSKPQEVLPQLPPQLTTSPGLPAAASNSKSTPLPKLDRLSPVPQAQQFETSDARALRNLKKSSGAESSTATTGEQAADESLKQPAAASAPNTPAAAAAKSLASGAESNSAALALQAPSAPPVSRSNTESSSGNGPAAEAKESAGNELSTANQAQLAGRIREYAAASQAPARQTEQRSAETIIATPDPKVLWRIGVGGFVERSEDKGATWNGQIPLPNAQLTAGSAPTAKTCWLVGEGGTILLTKDGTHWSKIPPPVPADFVSVSSKSASSAVITSSDGQKFSTSDGGKKWTPSQ